MDTQLEKDLFNIAQSMADDFPIDSDIIMIAEHAITNARIIMDQMHELLRDGHVVGRTPLESELIASLRENIAVWNHLFRLWEG